MNVLKIESDYRGEGYIFFHSRKNIEDYRLVVFFHSTLQREDYRLVIFFHSILQRKNYRLKPLLLHAYVRNTSVRGLYSPPLRQWSPSTNHNGSICLYYYPTKI